MTFYQAMALILMSQIARTMWACMDAANKLGGWETVALDIFFSVIGTAVCALIWRIVVGNEDWS